MNDVIKQLQGTYQNKKVLIVGLGLQGGGAGTAKFFCEIGARVTVTDLKTEVQLQETINVLKDYPITYVLGKHNIDNFLESDAIFIGPSVKWTTPELVQAEKRNIPIEMEAAFFVSRSPSKIIGITGTRGKSTTSQMIYEIIKNAGKSVFLAGNVRNTSTISLLKETGENDYVVLELSSWQLSGFNRKKISPHISVFTNFYPDHLNYYSSMEEYWHDKAAIFAYQTIDDYIIVNEALRDKIICNSTKRYFNNKTYSGPLLLPGDHNRGNAGAASLVGEVLKISSESIVHTLTHFKGLPFRIEKRATINGINIYNDTTSTTPIATEAALDSFKDKHITLILGGNSKNLPYASLIKSLQNVENIILLKGSFTEEIRPQLPATKIKGETFDTLEDAIQKAIQISKPGDILLFSPGATSFAQFKNEFDRGEKFNTIIDQYEKNTLKTA